MNYSGNTNGEKKYKVIGTRPVRHEGVDIVTGQTLKHISEPPRPQRISYAVIS